MRKRVAALRVGGHRFACAHRRHVQLKAMDILSSAHFLIIGRHEAKDLVLQAQALDIVHFNAPLTARIAGCRLLVTDFFKRSLRFNLFKTLDDVADFQVIEVVDQNAAFKAFFDFAYVVLKTFQRFQ